MKIYPMASQKYYHGEFDHLKFSNCDFLWADIGVKPETVLAYGTQTHQIAFHGLEIRY
jgi:hypothetical protein